MPPDSDCGELPGGWETLSRRPAIRVEVQEQPHCVTFGPSKRPYAIGLLVMSVALIGLATGILGIAWSAGSPHMWVFVAAAALGMVPIFVYWPLTLHAQRSARVRGKNPVCFQRVQRLRLRRFKVECPTAESAMHITVSSFHVEGVTDDAHPGASVMVARCVYRHRDFTRACEDLANRVGLALDRDKPEGVAEGTGRVPSACAK